MTKDGPWLDGYYYIHATVERWIKSLLLDTLLSFCIFSMRTQMQTFRTKSDACSTLNCCCKTLTKKTDINCWLDTKAIGNNSTGGGVFLLFAKTIWNAVVIQCLELDFYIYQDGKVVGFLRPFEYILYMTMKRELLNRLLQLQLHAVEQ